MTVARPLLLRRVLLTYFVVTLEITRLCDSRAVYEYGIGLQYTPRTPPRVMPVAPPSECRNLGPDPSHCPYGRYSTSYCGNTKCYKGPDESCGDLYDKCAYGLQCNRCGFCSQCYVSGWHTQCSQRYCPW